MSPAMDQRTRQLLIDVGAITNRGLTRKIQHRQCPHGCGQALLAAQDMGHEIWCDRLPITAVGEVVALLSGRETYTRCMGELDQRTPLRIRLGDADTDEVYAAHRCGQPQPPVNHRHVKPATRPTPTQDPPF